MNVSMSLNGDRGPRRIKIPPRQMLLALALAMMNSSVNIPSH